MRAALPPSQMMQQQYNTAQLHPAHSSNILAGKGSSSPSSSAWAADFMMQQPLSSPTSTALAGATANFGTGVQQEQHHQSIHAHVQPSIQSNVPWNPAMSAFRMNAMHAYVPQLHSQTPVIATSKRISWDKEFSAQELSLSSASTTLEEVRQDPLAQQQETTSNSNQFDGDELARTAGLLLEHVKHEQNPKFQQSQFLSLMKQLRDGEVIVDGNQVVQSDGTRTSASTIDVKGKGRAIDPITGGQGVSGPRPQWVSDYTTQGGFIAQQQGQEQNSASDSKQDTTQEDPNDAYFRQENAEYMKYWSEAGEGRQDTTGTSAETAMWDRLQEDWDNFEATASGIMPVTRYVFQENNPYLLGESSRTRHHVQHSGQRQTMLENVLELEAAVQRDPSNAALWYDLGVKQQENERESKALQALERAVELDPSMLPAWLALAISYTNDNDRQGTHTAVSQWVERNDKYRASAAAFRAQNPLSENALMAEKFSNMIQCLIAMARSDTTGEIDADLQIALAVLLNTNEEYVKAQDCFRTALAVRPDDWLLYNRVGATMANSGQAEDALQYYYKALELNPGYIRARFNLGISCMNLRRYDEAAQHILDALMLQDSDATSNQALPGDKQHVISNALWESLKTACLHMQRSDLADMCNSRDLEGFRKLFYG
ncbi:hypothetical protein EST38_g2873 [Candolleomyces aberdarensis]|uniref:Uncharacterized protein n=1 Tax=Candolleomyces aberdarensis TaxID=2316362 RepID=A0A4Q2DRD6_9AGAR|nr:hypothetical protein EST38_g2873 [Candolleomyces aberdarensis]